MDSMKFAGDSLMYSTLGLWSSPQSYPSTLPPAGPNIASAIRKDLYSALTSTPSILSPREKTASVQLPSLEAVIRGETGCRDSEKLPPIRLPSFAELKQNIDSHSTGNLWSWLQKNHKVICYLPKETSREDFYQEIPVGSDRLVIRRNAQEPRVVRVFLRSHREDAFLLQRTTSRPVAVTLNCDDTNRTYINIEDRRGCSSKVIREGQEFSRVQRECLTALMIH